MRERNSCIRSAAGGRRDAGDHLEGHALRHQRLDLFAATTEYERIATLETHDPLALLGKPYKQLVDTFLRNRVIVAFLARIDALGVATHQIEHRGSHQTVIDDDIGALHEPQRPEREQIRVPGSSTDQVYLSTCRLSAFLVEHLLQTGARCLFLASVDLFGHHAFNHLFPENPPVGDTPEALAHLFAEFLHEHGQPAIGSRDQGLEAGPQLPRQHRRSAAGRHRQHKRRPVDDGRHHERTQFGPVDHIDGHTLAARRRRYRPVDLFVIRGSNHHNGIPDLARLENGRLVIDFPLRRHCRQIATQLWRDDTHPGSSLQEDSGLACSNIPAADHQAGFIPDCQEDRQKFHGYALSPGINVLFYMLKNSVLSIIFRLDSISVSERLRIRSTTSSRYSVCHFR